MALQCFDGGAWGSFAARRRRARGNARPHLALAALAHAAVSDRCAAYIAWIYSREPGQVRRGTRLALATIRLLLVVLVVTMMYGWMRDRYRTDLPDLVIVVDDSQSMSFADQYADNGLAERLRQRLESAQLDEPSRINLAKSLLLKPGAGWLEQLRDKYNLKFYLLGTTARIQSVSSSSLEESVRAVQATQPASRLGDGLQNILEAQRGRPTAAVVLLSDGVTTEGKSIAEVAHYARRKGIPLFLLGVGDQRPPRDLRLSDLLVDEVVFLGDLVNFDFKLAGTGFHHGKSRWPDSNAKDRNDAGRTDNSNCRATVWPRAFGCRFARSRRANSNTWWKSSRCRTRRI